MSIPMYFAGNWKDSVNAGLLTAQMGYGFEPDGRLRLPEAAHHASLCVIDDAFLPDVLPELDALEAALSNGCCFDFERSPTPAHHRLLQAMQPYLHEPVLLPEAFSLPGVLPLVRTAEPCNNWQHFVAQTGRRYPGGWALELRPICTQQRIAGLPTLPAQLTPGGCWCRADNGLLECYDTRESLNLRLHTAAQHGCQAAIGLYPELKHIL